MGAYDPKVTPWMIKAEALPGSERTGQLVFLLRFAILAPSTHNTQPWKFFVGQMGHDEITLHMDRTRWLSVADTDQRELHLSAGCALENLLIASEHFGFDAQASYFPRPVDDTLIATVQFKPGGQTPAHHRHLFDCIPARYTNHKPYDGRPIDPAVLETMRAYVVEDDIDLFATSDMLLKRQVDALVMEADARQFADPAFRTELSHWIGQGVFGASWLVSKLGQLSTRLVDQGQSHARKDAEVLMSSPALAAITTKDNSRKTQVQAGQVFERLHLLATYLGISVQPMNQVLQVPALKTQLAGVLPIGPHFVQLVFRMGYAEPETEHTPRRELGEMML